MRKKNRKRARIKGENEKERGRFGEKVYASEG